MPLTPEGERYSDLAWAPTADVNLIAMRDDPEDGNSDLCLANVKGDETDITCKEEPSFAVIRALHWAQDGRSILGLGVKATRATFGIVRWRVKSGKPAFSPDLADWTKGRFLTDTDTPGKGVLDADGLARRQAAGADLQPGLERVPAVAGATIRRTSRSRAPSGRRCAPARCRGAATARSC